MKIKLFPFPESDDQMCCQMPKVNTKVFQNLFVKCLIYILLFKLISKKSWMLWRRYKKKCDMNDIECRVIMTLEGERTLADIVHFLHSQQVTMHQPTTVYHCTACSHVSLCITVYCITMRQPTAVYHCTACDCSHVTVQLIVSQYQ